MPVVLLVRRTITTGRTHQYPNNEQNTASVCHGDGGSQASGGHGGAAAALRGAADLHQARARRRHGRPRPRRLPLHVRRRCSLSHRVLRREVYYYLLHTLFSNFSVCFPPSVLENLAAT